MEDLPQALARTSTALEGLVAQVCDHHVLHGSGFSRRRCPEGCPWNSFAEPTGEAAFLPRSHGRGLADRPDGADAGGVLAALQGLGDEARRTAGAAEERGCCAGGESKKPSQISGIAPAVIHPCHATGGSASSTAFTPRAGAMVPHPDKETFVPSYSGPSQRGTRRRLARCW